MDTRLDNLFRALHKPPERRAESADARLEIRREEKEGGRRQRERKDEEERAAAEADLPRVSVPALKLFLEGLLRDSSAQAQPRDPAPAATPARHAAQAYGRNSAAPPPPASPHAGAEENAADEPGPAANLSLSAEEIEKIRGLLAELAAFDAQDAPELVLRPDENFLASLAAAIRAAKTG